MKVSEKTLELNVGAEILGRLRSTPKFAKAYLRGLTQHEERQEGVDFFAKLPNGAKLFAFQFKAPRSGNTPPFRYTIVRYQHDPLFKLAVKKPGSVFYVFPFYATLRKLHRDLPTLSRDTWLLDVARLDPTITFGSYASRTVRCTGKTATINPEYELQQLANIHFGPDFGIDPENFQRWFQSFREMSGDPTLDKQSGHRNPWLVRGLRVGVVLPSEAT